MVIISDDFDDSIKSTTREIKGYVEVTYSSSEAKKNANVIRYPEVLQIGNSDIPVNGIIDDDRKGKNYASLEKDYFQLDGTFVLPNNVVDKNPGMGYVSKETFEDDTAIPLAPFRITTSFGNTSGVNGITMYFVNNKPLELEITVQSNNNTETFTQEDCIINENGTVQLIFTERTIDIINIYVKDVLYPNRRIRLQEVDFGLSAIYENEELVSWKMVEQINKYGDEIVINECDITIGDKEKLFDNQNPKGITKYLNKDVKIMPYVGVITEHSGVEYCPQGEYYLDEYNLENLNVSLKCKSFLNKLNETLYNCHGDLLDIETYINDYTNYKIYIMTFFNEMPSPAQNNMLLGTGLERLTKFSSYALGYITEFKDQKSIRSQYDDYVGKTIMRFEGYHKIIYPVDKINSDVMKDYQTITANTPIKDITVSEYQYKNGSTETKILYETTINCNGEEIIVYNYGKPISTQTFIEVSDYSSLQILDARNHIYDKNNNLIYTPSYGGILLTFSYIKINYVGTVKFKVVQTQEIETQKSENYVSINNDGLSISIDNEYLGGSNARECSTAYINRRLKMWTPYSTKFSFNGNPGLEVGDTIKVESKYLDDNNKTKYDKVFITKIESEFKGSFSQNIEGDIVE